MKHDLKSTDYACRFHIIIDPSKIIYMNGILDSYEGIGMMRTADEHTGEIIIYTTKNNSSYVKELLEALIKEGIRIKILKTDFEDVVS